MNIDDVQTLKKAQIKQGSALTAMFKKSGEVLVYIGANADEDEIMKSLIILATQINQNKEKAADNE